jgi:hypothetical protein
VSGWVAAGGSSTTPPGTHDRGGLKWVGCTLICCFPGDGHDVYDKFMNELGDDDVGGKTFSFERS